MVAPVARLEAVTRRGLTWNADAPKATPGPTVEKVSPQEAVLV